MTDLIYQGDPKLTLDCDGADIPYKDGQPVMDRGLENLALISLFTEDGWSGNALFRDPAEQVGSGFMEAHRQPITLSALNEIRDAAEKALDSDVFGTVTAVTTNPRAEVVQTEITIEPPGKDVQTLLISKNGLNWSAQIVDPAYKKV